MAQIGRDGGRQIANQSSGGGGGGGSSPLADTETLFADLNLLTSKVSAWQNIADFENIGVSLLNYFVQGNTVSGIPVGTQGYDFAAIDMYTGALPACTAAGAGVGKTLTGNANGQLNFPYHAGNLISPTSKLLIRSQVATKDNGIYNLTQAGSAGTPFILTRDPAFDIADPSEIDFGKIVRVQNSDLTLETFWELTTPDPIVVDTTGLVFANAIAVGAWSVEVSNSANDYTVLSMTINNQPNGVATVQTVATPDFLSQFIMAYEIGLNLNQLPWKYFRIRWTPTSGGGLGRVIAQLKGF